MVRLHYLLLLIASLASTAVCAATYNLPAALGSGIFSSCSAITYVCSGSISVGNNDTVNFTAPMMLSINGNFTVGNNSDVIGNGNTVTIAVTGDISVGNSILSSINFSAGGDVTIGNAGSVDGDITAGGTLTLGTTTVTGYCTPSSAQCSNGVAGGCTSSTSGYVTTVTCTSDGTFRPPSGVTLALIEAWGGGGGGGAATGNPDKGGGGAGGQYAYKPVSVAPGTTYTVVVGTGGTGGSASAGGSGGDSTFNTSTVVAKGGAGGGYAGTNGGDGAAASGTTTGGVGDTVYRGGHGAAGSSGSECNNGGAGGGGAGSSGNGGNASGNTRGTGTANGGGNGGNASNDSGNGAVGSAYGGGGAGACAETNTNRTGGAGGAGKVIITYSSSTPSPIADWRMDESSWNGTANEVLDSSGNNNHGRARIANGTTALPTTTSGTPAYTVGSNNTCNYGQFDSTTGTTRTYTYVELSNMPTLPTSFTFAAWIRSTNASQSGQRILVRDDNNNGWGFSLGDPGSARVRFFNRNITNSGAVTGDGSNPNCGVFCLDTAAVITANNWFYVAVTIDTVGKRITHYVFNQSGTLLSNTSSAFFGTWADGTGTAAIGGETSASAEGRQSRFHFNGNIDEMQIYSGVLSHATIQTLLTRTRTCPSAGPHHIRIEHDGSAIACNAENVTIRACADAACSSYFTGGVTGNLTASSNTVAFSIPAGSSSTTASIHLPSNTAAADPQTVRLAASAISPTPADAGSFYCDKPATATTNNTTDCDISVSKAGFLFDVPNLSAGVASGAVNIRAITSVDSSNCTPLFQNKTRSIAFWGSYQNPATGTQSVQVNGGNIETTASPAYTSSYSLAFDATGTASLTSVRYDDVGQLQLGARYVGSAGNTPPDGGMIVTGSDSFVVKPASFSLTATCVDGTVSAATPATSDPKFCRAGKTFSVVTTALNAQNNATPNYGKETVPETVAITWSRQLPNPGSDGALPTGAPSFTGADGIFGTASNYAWTWDEVGILRAIVAVGDDDYLGAGSVSSTAYVGRFYPDHFKVDITPQCGGFVYSGRPTSPVVPGQPFTVKATAMNGTSATATTNYTSASGFAKTVDLSLSAGGGTGKLYVDTTEGGTAAIPVAKFVSNGEGEVLYNAASGKISYVFDTIPTTATTITLHAEDADTATSIGTDGSTQARSGRLRLSNAYGSELLTMRVPAYAEVWAGQWQRNTDDSCTGTSLASSHIALGNRTPATLGSSFSTIELRANGWWDIVLATPASAGALDIALDLGGGAAAAAACLTTWINGPTGHTGSAPLGHLLGNWCGGAYDKNPVARIKFGSPKTPYIYMRERY